MCIVITCQRGARPTEEMLEDAAFRNDDGAGIAWIEEVDDEYKVVWEKGLDVEGLKRLNAEVPHPYIVHLRKQSAGDATDNLTHPFPIGPQADDALDGIADRVLFHNGTVSNWKDYYRSFVASRDLDQFIPAGFDRMSDTRAMAYMVHHATQFADGENQVLQGESLLQIFDSTSRWAILDSDAFENEDRPTIRYLGDWYYQIEADDIEDPAFPIEQGGTEWEGGLVFSNRSWRRTTTTR